MAEMNGIDRLVAARKELEDALIVMAHLETSSSAMMKDHAAFLVAMDKRHELKKAEFDDKLKALIDMESSRG